MTAPFLWEALVMRADDIRPYTRTRKSMFKSNQKVSNYGLLRKSGCRGGYHVKSKMVYKWCKDMVYTFTVLRFFGKAAFEWRHQSRLS